MAHETELQRWQRNFVELLQELRVAQTGVQILFAFLLILAFSPGFDASDRFTQVFYLTALLSAAASTSLIIAPVAHHRMLFRRRRKPQLVRYSSRMALAGMMLMIISMVSTVLLATDAIVPRPAALVIAAAVAVLFLVFWAVLPFLQRRAAARDGDTEDTGEPDEHDPRQQEPRYQQDERDLPQARDERPGGGVGAPGAG